MLSLTRKRLVLAPRYRTSRRSGPSFSLLLKTTSSPISSGCLPRELTRTHLLLWRKTRVPFHDATSLTRHCL